MSLIGRLTTQYRYSAMLVKALPAVCLFCLLACSAPAQVEQIDAVSREVTAYNDPYPGQDAITDAISHEVTVYNDPYPGQDAISDAISHEITVYSDPYPGQDAITDAVSREITVLRETLGQAKGQPDDTFGISGASGAVVTAVFGDCIYVELADHASGLRVTGVTASEGQTVNVSGALKTNADMERYLEATDIAVVGEAPVEPLGALARYVHCGDLLASTLLGGGQRGMTGGRGTNMVGLLVRIAGKARSPQSGSFQIDDGSGKNVEVLLPADCDAPDAGANVSVTAILSIKKVGSNLLPVLRARRAADIIPQ